MTLEMKNFPWKNKTVEKIQFWKIFFSAFPENTIKMGELFNRNTELTEEGR